MRHQALRLGLVSLSALLLAACASPSKDISLIPNQTADITLKDGAFTQPLKIDIRKPNCKGECPRLYVNSLIFPGNRKVTEYIEQKLIQMVPLDQQTAPATYQNIRDFTEAYWKQAGPRDEAILSAKTRYRNKNLTTLELGVWYYLTGAAHGDSEIQLLNWDNQRNQPLSFAEIVKPTETQTFNQRLQKVYQAWLATQEAYLENPEQYIRLWPFHPSQNIALTDLGVVVKYNSYEIAPYSSGQPELLIPYADLQGILQPQYLPR